MRIAWFTPLSGRTAIGRFSAHVTARLARAVHVDLWTDTSPDEWLDTDVPVIPYQHAHGLDKILASYDHVIFNLGDHAAHHGRMLEVMRYVPGVVVLHDRVLHHLMAGVLLEEDGGLERYLELVGDEAGPAARHEAEESIVRGTPLWEDGEFVMRAPLAAHTLTGARAAVVHSSSHADEVRAGFSGPLLSSFLPCYQAELPPRPTHRRATERLLLVTHGRIGPHKQVHAVVEAIGRRPGLADQIEYLVAGPVTDARSYRAELARLVEEHGLTRTVRFLGELSEADWFELLARADMFAVLRDPAVEGSSAALAEALEFGAPTIVTDTAVYAELPDNAVVKVPRGDVDAIADAIERLVTDVRLREELGRAARAVAETRTIERYARELLGFLESLATDSPVNALRARIAQVARAFGATQGTSDLTAGRLAAIDRALNDVLGASGELGKHQADGGSAGLLC